MISKHNTALILGGTSWRHLMEEIYEAKHFNDKYLQVTTYPTGAGFSYRVRFSKIVLDGYCDIDDWMKL